MLGRYVFPVCRDTSSKRTLTLRGDLRQNAIQRVSPPRRRGSAVSSDNTLPGDFVGPEFAMTTRAAIKKALSEVQADIRRPRFIALFLAVVAFVAVEQYLVHCRAEAILQREEPEAYQVVYGNTSPGALCASRAALFGTILVAAAIAGLTVRVVQLKRLPPSESPEP